MFWVVAQTVSTFIKIYDASTNHKIRIRSEQFENQISRIIFLLKMSFLFQNQKYFQMVKSHRITNKSHRGYDLVYVAIVKFGNDAKHLRRTSLLRIVHSNLFCNLFNQREPSSEVHKIFTLLSRVKLVRTSSVSTISFSMRRTTATRAKTPFCWLRWTRPRFLGFFILVSSFFQSDAAKNFNE